MIPFELALGTALRHWKAILGGIALLGLIIALWATRERLASVKLDLNHERAAHAQTIANVKEAQAKAGEIAERRLRDVESLYRRNADEAQALHVEALADANASADRYIAAHSVRGQGAECPASGAATAPTGERAGVPAPVSTAPELVTVTPADVRACAAAVAYGDRAHAWALTLDQESR